MIIAIDGPAWSRKSTIAKLIAKQLNLVYIDTGAMYRAVGLKAKRNNIACSEQEKIEEMLKNTEVELKNEDGATAVYLDGENVSEEIRLPEISRMASDISAVPGRSLRNGGNAARNGEENRYYSGRKRYRNVRSAQRGRQDFSHRKR